MKMNVELADFDRAFEVAGRGYQFTQAGLETLYHFLLEMEEATGEEIELDVIAICCEWEELTPEEVVEEYGYLAEQEAPCVDDIVDALEQRTILLETSKGTYVVLKF
jgi:hypothetical protein